MMMILKIFGKWRALRYSRSGAESHEGDVYGPMSEADAADKLRELNG